MVAEGVPSDPYVKCDCGSTVQESLLGRPLPHQPRATPEGVSVSPSQPASSEKWVWLYFRKRFHDKIRQGVKVRTLRAQRIKPGTAVATPVGLIRILDVVKATVRHVGESYWHSEGCDSPEDFFAEFRSIHPDLEADLNAELWLHHFRLEIPA